MEIICGGYAKFLDGTIVWGKPEMFFYRMQIFRRGMITFYERTYMICEKLQTFSVECNSLREHKCPAREHKFTLGGI